MQKKNTQPLCYMEWCLVLFSSVFQDNIVRSLTIML